MIYIKRLIFILLFSFILCYISYDFFIPLYTSNTVIIEYGIHPFNICDEQPVIWKYCKIWFIVSYIYSAIFISNFIYKFFYNLFSYIPFKKKKRKIKNKNKLKSKNKFNSYDFLNINQNSLQLLIGENSKTHQQIILPEKSLYQNILITGTIGTGKTSSAMYPFTKQLISYESNNFDKKLGMLILDVKGNYLEKVLEFAKKYNRENDVIKISLNSNYFYNPLHKPNLKPTVLANRLKTILLLFSKNNSESFWLDKAEQVLAEAIKLCRLYNNGYVTFQELHKLITNTDYYEEKIKLLRTKFLSGNFDENTTYDLLSAITFFENDFLNLDSRTLSILKSEITRITNTFICDYSVLSKFNPPIDKLNFLGFNEVLEEGKIVVLNMNINEYSNLSKIIAAYLKLDFQTDVMTRLANCKDNNFRSVCFISDEYSEYCTDNDANFFSQSREAKCINIVSTQSYTSLLNSLHQKETVNVILQNLINKLWFRNDDIFTIETAQKQIGKEEKEKISTGISENAKETVFSYFTNSLNSKNSSISETISKYTHSEYIFDSKVFTQDLENFSCISFLSDGTKIMPPQKIHLFPYFLNK